jgi:YD repeat-containing protein
VVSFRHRRGNQATVTDDQQHTWTSTFDQLGRFSTKTDPDAGTSQFTYDNPAVTAGDLNNDGRNDIIARDPAGDLWLYPHTGGTGTNTLGTRIKIGVGWNGMNGIL